MPKSKTAKLPKMPADTGFGLGLFCGTMLGALGVYMLVTPEGKQLKQTVIDEFKRQQQNLILDTIKPGKEEVSGANHQLIQSVRTLIKRVRTVIASGPAKVVPKQAAAPHSPRKHYFKQK